MWGRRKPDVPVKYDYTPVDPPANPDPQGTECVEHCRNRNRFFGDRCNQCGHTTCFGSYGCDACKITVRLNALEGPS